MSGGRFGVSGPRLLPFRLHSTKQGGGGVNPSPTEILCEHSNSMSKLLLDAVYQAFTTYFVSFGLFIIARRAPLTVGAISRVLSCLLHVRDLRLCDCIANSETPRFRSSIAAVMTGVLHVRTSIRCRGFLRYLGLIPTLRRCICRLPRRIATPGHGRFPRHCHRYSSARRRRARFLGVGNFAASFAYSCTRVLSNFRP